MLYSSIYVMVQMIIAILIIALGFYVFKSYPIDKKNVMNMVLAAIFIMITLICKRFLTVMIPLFGSESFKIGLEYIPLMVAGFFLSPSYAFLIGLCSDLIGLILVPTGFPFFGFTLTMILVSVIPSLIKTHAQNISEKTIGSLVQYLIIILGTLGAIYIYKLNEIKISDTLYPLTSSYKFVFIVICFILVILFLFLIRILKSKINFEESKEFSIWLLSVTLVEVICTLFLSPFWLDIMYGIPFVVSLCIRIIKECFILPIEVFVGYTVIKVMKRVFENKA